MNKQSVSEDGIKILHHFEGCRLEAYPDPGTGGDPWTIGWGHTGPEVHKGLKWTQQKADAVFIVDLGAFEHDVLSLLKVPVTQCEFDALVSFAYNCGSDIDMDKIPEGLGDSTLLKLLNEGNRAGAAREFLKWDKAGGRKMKGLSRRRMAESQRFLGATAEQAIAAGEKIK